MPEPTLTTSEIAEYCQVTTVAVLGWINKEEFPHAWQTPGGHWRIPLSDFRSFLEQYGMPVVRIFFLAKEKLAKEKWAKKKAG